MQDMFLLEVEYFIGRIRLLPSIGVISTSHSGKYKLKVATLLNNMSRRKKCSFFCHELCFTWISRGSHPQDDLFKKDRSGVLHVGI